MLTIKNLNFSYNNALPYLIDNLNLQIESGSYVSILGENGSAKSTLLKLILGFLKPNGGTISLSTSKLGYVPQRVENFNPQFPISVNEMLLCHFKVLKLKNKGLINKSLEIVNMLQYKNSLIGNLSGGQLQKVFIARALMGEPELLILDEPSTGIDIPSQEDIYKIISNLNKKSGVTVISVEHNLKAALNNSSHIFKIERGKGTLYTISEYYRLTQ
ncbi:metal ABC transporter ATP-binding protein [Clostridium sp. SYSU_GA19001]|uniref:metal ABC transporter ATP-binding protein n=1 Tax=Clostridium caldaquaticum TaxID=2940653 RepID=UPI0020777CAC|nr:metal ABC transporter ATP-binding protein [Clostridium caldaquaticum]MCM8711159.1 metal ABC transporter ATP-binding protein [Clostridium caldaquaticum]